MHVLALHNLHPFENHDRVAGVMCVLRFHIAGWELHQPHEVAEAIAAWLSDCRPVEFGYSVGGSGA